MKILLIDDMRNDESLRTMGYGDNLPTQIARTYDEGIRALKEDGPFDLLYLDHDLGEDDIRKTGYGVMNFLEANAEYLPESITVVSSNPVGRKQMQVVICKLYS